MLEFWLLLNPGVPAEEEEEKLVATKAANEKEEIKLKSTSELEKLFTKMNDLK